MSTAQNWVDSIERPDTRANRSAVLNRIANYLNPGSNLETFDWTKVTRQDAQRLKDYFLNDRKMKPTSVRFQLSTLRSVLRYHVEEGLLSSDVLARVRAVNLPANPTVGHTGRALSRMEMGTIFGLESRTPVDRMDIAIFSALVTTGMRVSELCSVKDEQLKPTGAIRFMGKGSKERDTWLSGPTSYYLDLHKEDCNRELPWLFQNVGNRTPGRLDRFHVRASLNRLCRRSGVPTFTPHDCRRTVATILLDEGVDLLIVSDLLGHSSVEVTKLYDRRDEQTKIDALKKLQGYMESYDYGNE